MCVIAIAHRVTPRYPLIVAANRDERHARATLPADWWTDRPDILSGRDLVAGGTWLGVGTRGRFAAVTNIVEDPRREANLSRGTLVGNFLVSRIPADRYVAALAPELDRYGAFNLLLLDESGLRYASNRRETATLAPGIHAFSNNRPGEDWPKVRLLGEALEATIADADGTGSQADRRPAGPAEAHARLDRLAARLLDILSGPAARGTLAAAPDSVFVVGDEFGTRCSTVLAVDAGGHAVFVEQSFGPGGEATDARQFHFRAEAFAR